MRENREREDAGSLPPASCPRMGGCPLYPMFKMRTFLQTWIALYCEADFTRCERYKRASAGGPIPPTLLPNGRDINEIANPKSG